MISLRAVAIGMLPALVGGVSVEAGIATGVSVHAPVYDARSTLPHGCPPAGCVGENTRDGNAESRWSCKPSLNPTGSGCLIAYTFDEAQELEALEIDLYNKGQDGTRTIEVYVDGWPVTTWTSSGSADGFETVPLPRSVVGQPASMIELFGVLSDSEWLSINEVKIVVAGNMQLAAPRPRSLQAADEPAPTPEPTTNHPVYPIATPAPTYLVEAPALGTTILVTGSLWDTRTAADNGCDPDGCVPANMRIFASATNRENSRWSCKPELGGPGAKCQVDMALTNFYTISQLALAFYKGDQRKRTVEISVDGNYVTTYTSTGLTDRFEYIDIPGIFGEVISVKGVLEDDEWLSIMDSEIFVSGTGEPQFP